MDPRILKLIEMHEGRRNKMYKCPAGFNTIGVGHNLDANPISDRAIDVILEDDLKAVERQLDKHLPWWRREDEVRQAAMIDMCFNMGIGTLLEFQYTLETWKHRFYSNTMAGLRRSKWYKQVGQRGERIVQMVHTGEWPTEIQGLDKPAE